MGPVVPAGLLSPIDIAVKIYARQILRAIEPVVEWRRSTERGRIADQLLIFRALSGEPVRYPACLTSDIEE
jgi:hypothetical protein